MKLTKSQENYVLFNTALKIIRKKRKLENDWMGSIYRDRFYNRLGKSHLNVKVCRLSVDEQQFLASFADSHTYTGRFIFHIPLGQTRVKSSNLSVEVLEKIKVMEVEAKLDGVV